MSFAAFERLPHQLGWEYEYYGGRAHIAPATPLVTFVLSLEARAVSKREGVRPLSVEDAARLRAPFLDAFRLAPEYADFSLDEYRRRASQYIHGFFGSVRGEWSPISVVAEMKGSIIGAALVKRRQTGPLLDCLFVCPNHARRGLATALVSRVVEGLCRDGHTQLLSYAMLANEASMAWHTHFGFQEIPDLQVARLRHRCYQHELDRHHRLGDLTETALAALGETAARCQADVERLRDLEKRDFLKAHPHFW
jgi:GNAT superfamily N-acetyltransferase